MSTTRPWVFFFAVFGCKDEPKTTGAASASVTVSSAAPTASAVATASASAGPEANRQDCPPGSTGPGTFGHPCEAKGSARLVEIAWNGKYDTSGAPSFKTNSKATKTVLYGRLAIYFYDKSGAQIDVKDQPERSDKSHAFHAC